MTGGGNTGYRCPSCGRVVGLILQGDLRCWRSGTVLHNPAIGLPHHLQRRRAGRTAQN